MGHSLPRIFRALVLVLALTPSILNAESAKLDRSLRQSMSRGCSGMQSVIISTEPGYREALRASLTAHGDSVTGEFPALEAITARVHCDDLSALAGFAQTRAVSVNAEVHASVHPRQREGESATRLKRSNFATLGVTGLRAVAPADPPGKGVGVAVIDSGIEPGADFGERITAFYDFTGGGIRATSPSDAYGHGTHVAGLIGSEFVGVATHARLIGLKVLDREGQGLTDDVVRAIEFAIANRHVLGIHVLNLSIGHPIYESAATDPLVQAVEHATRKGLTVIVAAGNFGVHRVTGEVGYGGIVSPANAPSALTSGAVDTLDTVSRRDDRMAPYSSRGPSRYDGFTKPDLVAPGHNLLSVAAANSTLRRAVEARGNQTNYMRLSGTSVAAGVTSGIAALALQVNYRLTPNALKAVLAYTSIPVRDSMGDLYDPLTQGTGQIQAEGAVALAGLINPSAPMGSDWLRAGFSPSTQIGSEVYTWSESIIWGHRRVTGATVMNEQRLAWASEIVWGSGFDSDDNVVWGNALASDDNVVWGNSIVWANE
ncbi:MAG TPA: S8 family serine peptidase [Vicinamibacterales bacterium]|nr:S8 family serine peptidase [Vicinamibacterales bacterium]